MEKSIQQLLAGCFVEGVYETASTMTGFELTEKEEKVSLECYGEIAGAMFVTGSIRALLVISTSRSHAAILTAYMTGIEPGELKESFYSDSVVEMVNMAAGVTKAKLREKGYNMDISFPFAIAGTNIVLEMKNHIERYEYTICSDNTGLKISVYYI
jgi:CheY-specific phosphatase CheX